MRRNTSTAARIAEERATTIQAATVLSFDKDVKIKNPDTEEGGEITVRNTYTIYRDGDWFAELEQGADGFTRTRTLNKVNPKVCATGNLHITATPDLPRSRKRWGHYGDNAAYDFTWKIEATLNGKPVTVSEMDLLRLAKFAASVTDGVDHQIDTY